MKTIVSGLAVTAALVTGIIFTDQSAPTVETRLAAAGSVRPVDGARPIQAAESDRAAMLCATRAEIFGYLAAEYDQRPVASWLRSPRTMMILFGSRDGETWSTLMIEPGGMACLVGGGLIWRPLIQTANEGPDA